MSILLVYLLVLVLSLKYVQNVSGDAFGSKLLFTGKNQKRPGLGINVGTITSGMSQWVFTNKFKHADVWRPVSSGNRWLTFSMAG